MFFDILNKIDNTINSVSLEFLGIHWVLALFIICIILMILDIFLFGGDKLTYFAHFVLTFIMLYLIPIHNFIYLILFGMFFYGVILFIHLFIWRKYIALFFNKCISPDKIKIGNDALKNKCGIVKNIKGKWFIKIADDWLECYLDADLPYSAEDKLYGEVININNDNIFSVKILNKNVE